MTMTPITNEDTPALVAEIARLRLALAHLAVYARAVLECRDNGGLTLAQQGFPAYQASAAMDALEGYVTRTLAGDLQPITEQHLTQAWDRHAKRPMWGEEYMTLDRYRAAINDLLWHPERQFATVTAPPVLPCDGTCGFADDVAGANGYTAAS